MKRGSTGNQKMEECEQMDKSLRDLIEIVHFTENVSAKIHRKKNEAEIYRIMKEEFRKSKRYNASILLLTDDGTKLRIVETSIIPRKVKAGEKVSRLRLKDYRIKLNKTSIYNKVIREGKTLQVNANEVIGELVPKPLARLISKIIGYENKPVILTPLKRHEKIIGVLAVSSPRLAEQFIPSVKNLAQHISNALELADEHAVLKRADEALRESREKLKAQYKGVPIPTYTWRRAGEDLVLVDYNDAAVKITQGNVANYVGKKASEMYQDRPSILEDLLRCSTEKINIRQEMPYRFMFTGETKYLDVSYVFVPPDLVMVHTEDITERKKTEDALRKSEEKYRTVVEHSLQGIVVVQDFRIVYANKAFAKITGNTVNELLSLPSEKVKELVHPDDQPFVWERFRNRQAGKPVTPRYEYRGVRKDGTVLWLEMFAHRIEYDGKPAVQAAIIDVTHRKKMEETLKESEQKLKDIIDTSPDAIVWTDTMGKVTLVNRKGCELTGFSKNELIGKNFMDVEALTQKSKEKILENFMKRIEGIDTPPYEVEVVAKNGETIPAELSASAIYEGDKIVGTQSIFRDLRERKRMEEKLKEYSEHLEELVQKRTEELLESEKRYSILVEEASDGVVMIQDGKAVFANKKGAEIIGYSKNEIIGLPFEKVVDEKYLQLATEGYMRLMQGETVSSMAELELIAKTGERVPIEASSALIHYQGRPADLVIIRDIRERKRMEEQRLKLERLAAIGEVATMVGHDLRNPLQSIENATYYLRNEFSRLVSSIFIPQETMDMLQVINDSVQYADRIVRDLHDFASPKKPVYKKTNINTLVKETLSQVEAPENVKITTELGDLPEIRADKDMVKRILVNLAENAIQAMAKGGRLKVSTKKTEESVEVSFKDTGTGISKDNMIKLFTPFFTTKAQGIGMGLAICKKLSESYGGSIEVKSEEGKGTIFTAKLPIQQKMEVKTSGEE